MPRFALKPIETSESSSEEKKPANYSRYLTMDQVTAAFGVTRQSVKNWVHRGRLHPVKINGALVFNPDEIEEEQIKFALSTRTGRPKKPPSFSPSTSATSSEMPSEVRVTRPTVPEIVADDPVGRLASDATKMFNDGKSVRDVVIELRVSYEIAEHIYESYKRCGPELHVSPQGITALRQRLNWLENPPTVEGLINAIGEWEKYLLREPAKPNLKPNPSPNPTQSESTVKPEKKGINRVIPDSVFAELDYESE
jgi:hypothetical protein